MIVKLFCVIVINTCDIKCFSYFSGDVREDEMEDNMSQVGDIVGNLRSMAVDMGNEIDQQNQHLTGLDAEAASDQSRVKAANRRIHQMLENA